MLAFNTTTTVLNGMWAISVYGVRPNHLNVYITDLSLGDVDVTRALGVSPIWRKFNIEFGDELNSSGNFIKMFGDFVEEFLKQMNH